MSEGHRCQTWNPIFINNAKFCQTWNHFHQSSKISLETTCFGTWQKIFQEKDVLSFQVLIVASMTITRNSLGENVQEPKSRHQHTKPSTLFQACKCNYTIQPQTRHRHKGWKPSISVLTCFSHRIASCNNLISQLY